MESGSWLHTCINRWCQLRSRNVLQKPASANGEDGGICVHLRTSQQATTGALQLTPLARFYWQRFYRQSFITTLELLAFEHPDNRVKLTI